MASDAKDDTLGENAMRHQEFDGASALAGWLARTVRTDEVMRELAKLTAEIHELRTMLTTRTPSTQRNELLDTHDAALYIGMSEAFLRKARRNGRGPGSVWLGGRSVRYRLSVLDAWVDERGAK